MPVRPRCRSVCLASAIVMPTDFERMIVLPMVVSCPCAASEPDAVAADEDRCIKDSVYPVEAERGEVNGGDEPRRDVPDGPRDRRVPKGSRHPIVGQEL